MLVENFEVLVSKVELVKNIKTYKGCNLMEAVTEANLFLDINKNEEITITVNSDENEALFDFLKKNNCVSFTSRDNWREEYEAEQKRSTEEYEEAERWVNSLPEKEQRYIEIIKRSMIATAG